jgi:hypothetical protein
MSFWLMRQDAPSISIAREPPSLAIRSRRRPTIQEGDTIVTFSNAGGEAKFLDSATVTTVETQSPVDADRNRVTLVSVDAWRPLKEAVDLKNLLFSLTFVRNFAKPMLHFRRGYRTLPANDYETIMSGEVFVSRTLYYTLLHALPDTMRTAFQIERLLVPVVTRAGARFDELLRRLEEFIADRILSVGDVTIQLSRAIEECELVDANGKSLEHEFRDDPGKAGNIPVQPDNIAEQADRFESLREILGQNATGADGGGFARSILSHSTPDALPSEGRFERLFVGSP